MRIDLNWIDFKTRIAIKTLPIHYVEKTGYYFIWAQDDLIVYTCSISDISGNADLADFENNYKADANKTVHPLTEDGKEIVKSEMRPLACTTMFTSIGDSETVIGEGKWLVFDFSNDDDEVEMPSGSEMKRKRLEFSFLDPIWIKEGAIYQFDAPKGAYVDFYIVCPSGQYYYDNDNVPKLATEDTPIAHFVCKHPIYGSCPMGDELNSESASEEIPTNYKFWIDITVPDDNNTCHGHFSLEIYRKRTKIL